MRSISRFWLWWSLIRASMPALDFIMFNWSRRRFGNVIAKNVGQVVYDTSDPRWDVLHCSLRTWVSGAEGSGVVRVDRCSDRTSLAHCRTRQGGQISGIGGISSSQLDMAPHFRYIFGLLRIRP
jgi:hypothetical protein